MAKILSPSLFFVTSPRSPFKMRPEIDLLSREFAGKRWTSNIALQTAFMKRLASLPEYKGSVNQNNPALSARDRITRGPKALGLINLERISLTPAGENFLNDDLAAEALLRQILKFQLPSPFHQANSKVKQSFCVRPYLEIIRLVYELGRLAFDELCLFGMQLTDWHKFEAIVSAVRQFRIKKEKNKGFYKKFFDEECNRIVAEIYQQKISTGQIQTRESSHTGLDEFIAKKFRNMRDYADACLRYLRATGLITVSSPGRTMTIIESRRDEVEYILETIERDPVFVTDETNYCKYLYDSETPTLLTDNRIQLERKAVKVAAVNSTDEAKNLGLNELKGRIRHTQSVHREAIIDAQITELKSFTRYDEVVNVFNDIKARSVYDPSLIFEWNTWRAMTMLDGGNIRANLKFDDAGNPLSIAPGKSADIVCDYGNFIVIVEVTLLTGCKQYDAEGEPVARHLGDIKAKTGKPAYCLFVAPKINESTVSHFYMLHKTRIKHYGGKSVIIPLTLENFLGMLRQSKNCGYVPSPDKLRVFCEYSMSAANDAEDEEAWYLDISQKTNNWLGCI